MVQSVSGGGHFGGGMFINTYDHARFGLLFARRGKWQDKQLLSERWVASVTEPSAANKNYGLLWWINNDEHLGKLLKPCMPPKALEVILLW
jgi:CubicO group peptidase (beta-lactamase class C family)